MTDAQCTGVGSLAQLKDSARSSLASIFFNDHTSNLTPSSIPDPLQALSKAIGDTRDSIKTTTPVRDITLAYADLLQTVAIVRCQTKIATFPVANEVSAQAERLYLPAIEWQIVIGPRDNPKCSNARDCVTKRRIEVASLLRDSDPRDVVSEEFDAVKLFKALPPDPPQLSMLDKLYPSRIPILEYEKLLANLRHLERAVGAKRESRLEAAQNFWNKAIARRDQAVAFYANVEGNYKRPTNPRLDMEITIGRLPEMISGATETIAFGERAALSDRRYEPQLEQLRSAMRELEKNARGLHAAAHARLKEIVKEEQDRKNLNAQRAMDRAPK